MLNLTNEQLQLVVRSLSITYDATNRKLDRLTGKRYDEALDEIDLCNETLALAKAEQMRRLRSGERIMPIGTPRVDDVEDWNRK